MFYLDFLTRLHEMLRPECYLEIGVRWGDSLALSRCRTVGIDPAFTITKELDAEVALVRTTSDEYFARDEPLRLTGGRPFDLAFIDGLHLFEYSLRDFMHAEKHCSTRGVIVFDDILPKNVDQAARVRHTQAWTGDVYAILAVLARYRPELVVVPVATRPTGLLLVTGLDPSSTVLADNYAAIMAEYRRPDPQPVPSQILDGLVALPPDKVLASPVWELLGPDADHGSPDARARVAEAVAGTLGPTFAGAVQA